MSGATRSMLALATAVALCYPASAKVRLPFVGDVSDEQLCGGATRDCRATSSQSWLPVESGWDYSGQPENVLGRSFFGKNLLDHRPCVTTAITPTDVVESPPFRAEIQIHNKQRRAFSFNLLGRVSSFFKSLFGGRDDDQARVLARFERAVNSELNSRASIEHRRIDLRQESIDRSLAGCLDVASGQRVITGFSVATVSGESASRRLAELVASFEASAEYRSLSADLQAQFQSQREKVVALVMQPTTMILGVAYRER